jgi:hypothetical protein
VRESDGLSYNYELEGCDGTDATIVAQAYCEIQVATLRLAPFSLDWGSSVYVTIVAYNFYGDSLTSEPGNGAIIITYPDAPINL